MAINGNPTPGPDKSPDIAGKIADVTENVTEKTKAGLEKIKENMPKNVTDGFKKAMEFFKKIPEKIDSFLKETGIAEKLFGIEFDPNNPKKNGSVLNRILGTVFLSSKEKPESDTDLATIRTKPQEEPEEKSGPETLDEILEGITNYQTLHEKYEAAPDGSKVKAMLQQELRNLARYAIFHKEGASWSPEIRQRLVNLKAINFGDGDPENMNSYGRLLYREGIEPPTDYLRSSRSESLFGENLGSLQEFKTTLIEKLQPNALQSNDETLQRAVMILSCSALGAYQIVPIEHFKRMGWVGPNGRPTAEHLYNFLKNGEKQDQLYGSIIDDLGKRYDWKIPSMAVAYYAGTKWGDKINRGEMPIDQLSATQAYGYESPADYAKSTTKIIDEKLNKNA